MSSPADTASLQSVLAAEGTVSQAPSLLQRVLVFPVKFFWGMVFCQGLAGSILVVGWTYRLAQRSAFKFWCSRAEPPRTGPTFFQFLAGQETTSPQAHWPNWFARQNLRHQLRLNPELGASSRLLKLLSALVHSLWLNFWIGLRGIATTWVVTLPAAILWWFGWYDGWNNSFNKGYEQAIVGPLLSILGIAWFITAMFYVPVAQARQAVTGDWRCFFQFRLIRKLARDRWVYCVLLAGLYTLLSLPLSVMKTSPMFWMHNSTALATLTTTQVLALLKGYYFWCALVVLPGFVLVHLVAARIYASGLLSLLQAGELAATELAPAEREVLDRLGLLAVRPRAERHVFVRFIAWSGTGIGRAVGKVALVLIWFGFVAQIYITQFLNYHSGLGWMNQALVQLPWFRYLPTSVRNPLTDVFWALLIFFVAQTFSVLYRRLLVGRRAKGWGIGPFPVPGRLEVCATVAVHPASQSD
jgi:hypothetical protein